MKKILQFLSFTALLTVSCVYAQTQEGRWERLNLTGKDQWWYVVDNVAYKDTREYLEYLEKTQKTKPAPQQLAHSTPQSNNANPIIVAGKVQGVWFCKSTNQYVSKLADQKCPVPWVIK